MQKQPLKKVFILLVQRLLEKSLEYMVNYFLKNVRILFICLLILTIGQMAFEEVI